MVDRGREMTQYRTAQNNSSQQFTDDRGLAQPPHHIGERSGTYEQQGELSQKAENLSLIEMRHYSVSIIRSEEEPQRFVTMYSRHLCGSNVLCSASARISAFLETYDFGRGRIVDVAEARNVTECNCVGGPGLKAA